MDPFRQNRGSAIDNVRLDRAYGFVSEAELVNRLGTQRMHEHVGRGDQLLQGRHSGGRLEIKNDAALVAIEMQKAAGHAFMPVRAIAAKRIPLRAFDLDHVSTHIGHDMGGERPHDHVGEIKNADAAQGAVCRRRVHQQIPSLFSLLRYKIFCGFPTRRTTSRRRHSSMRRWRRDQYASAQLMRLSHT